MTYFDKCLEMQCSANPQDKCYVECCPSMKLVFFPKIINKVEFALAGVIAVLILMMSGGFFFEISSALNEEPKYNVTTGKINSTLQNTHDNNTWLLSGSWKSNLFSNTKFNHSNPAKFSAKIDMIMANGSFSHKHKMSHFMLANASTDELSNVYDGYVSVSMELGPVFAIPIRINDFKNGTISLSLELLEGVTVDQAKVINHFEGKPITGIMGKIIN